MLCAKNDNSEKYRYMTLITIDNQQVPRDRSSFAPKVAVGREEVREREREGREGGRGMEGRSEEGQGGIKGQFEVAR